MVLRLVPGALHLVGVGAGGFLDEDGVGRAGARGACVAAGGREAPAAGCVRSLAPPGRARRVVIGSTVISLSSSQRALGGQVEPADRRHVVAPPLEPRRRRHPEAVHVEDAAADAELGDLGHRRHPAVAHPLERLGHVARRAALARGEPEPEPLERGRHQGPLRGGARGGDQHPEPAVQQRLDRLGALAGDLVVGLVLAERLALRVERHRPSVRWARSVSQRSASPGVGATT